jgi:Transposase DDE domain
LRLLAADKTTLALPESPSLWKCFGAHKGQQGLGAIAVELCCLFHLISRAPLLFVYGKSCTSELKLIHKLIQNLKKNDLLLLDSGFYYCTTFSKILRRHAHLITPAKKTLRPEVLRTLAQGDYLCQIKDYNNKTTLRVRVLFVHRNGFRRRRLVTSLLDPSLFTASDLARLYHMRWDIETFYRDFKHTLRATSWHCHTPLPFTRNSWCI